MRLAGSRSPWPLALALVPLSILALVAGSVASARETPPNAPEWDARLRGKRFFRLYGDAQKWRDVLYLCRDGVAYGRWKSDASNPTGPPGIEGDEIAEWDLRTYEGKACLWMAVQEAGEPGDSGCSELSLDGELLVVDADRWTADGDAGC